MECSSWILRVLLALRRTPPRQPPPHHLLPRDRARHHPSLVTKVTDRGVIDVDGVGVQQVDELGSGIVRTTATVSDIKS